MPDPRAAAPAQRLTLHGEAHLFGRRPELMEALATEARRQRLVIDQLVDLDPVADWIVRRGRLRLAEFLPDGRELARGVLETGTCFTTRTGPPDPDDDRSLDRDRITLMALGESELWRLDPDAFRRHDVR